MPNSLHSGCRHAPCLDTSSCLLLSILELSDTKVFEPLIRALLGTAAHFCEVLVDWQSLVPSVVVDIDKNQRAINIRPSFPEIGSGKCKAELWTTNSAKEMVWISVFSGELVCFHTHPPLKTNP